MSSLKVLVLFCSLLVTINSSPIGELPKTEQSPLPETSDENQVIPGPDVEESKMLKESKLVVQEANATTPELESSYCSHFDNTCITCLKIDNCTMVRYTKEVKHDTNVEVTDYEFKCFDIKKSLKDIGEAFENQRYDVIQSKSQCPNLSPKQSNLKSNKEEKTESVVKAETTEVSAGSDQTTANSTSTTNNTTTKTPTTSQTTLTSSANITTANTTTSQNTTEVTKTTTSTPTSATNSTQLPITSKDPPPPASGGGWSFWSFFGGILLTLGLSAIGFVGFKYYKARAGQPGGFGLNYNRF